VAVGQPELVPHDLAIGSTRSQDATVTTIDFATSAQRAFALLPDFSTEDLLALADRATAAEISCPDWPPGARFWFSGTSRVRLSSDEERALRQYWTRLLVRLADPVANQDVRRREVGGRLGKLLSQLLVPIDDLRAEGEATGILERVFGDRVWLAVAAIWNATCAAVLESRLEPQPMTCLERAWHMAGIGPTPRARMAATSFPP